MRNGLRLFLATDQVALQKWTLKVSSYSGCRICGSVRRRRTRKHQYHFHHVDPKTRRFVLGSRV